MNTMIQLKRSARALAMGVGAVLFLLAAGPLCADDWPHYRGPNHDGISREKGWVAAFPQEGPKQLWKTSVGTGASSVSVSKGRLYTMGNIDNQDIVYCLDAKTGKEIWRHTYACPLAARQFEGGPAATPTVVGDRVFTLSHTGDLFCLDAATGQARWSKNLKTDFGGSPGRWGYACSPRAENGWLILDAGGSSSTIAVRQQDGGLVWKAGDDKCGYATPVLYDTGGSRAVLMFKGKALVSLNLADGRELWRHPWRTSYDVNAAAPIVDGRRIYISSGYNTGCALLEIRDNQPSVVWQNKNICNHFNSSVLWQDHVYGVNGNAGRDAPLTCIELATGKLKWAEDSVRGGSVMVADGKLIALTEGGELVTAEASPASFAPVARAKVLGGRCWVVPVLSGGKLYCRNNQGDLVCLDVAGK